MRSDRSVATLPDGFPVDPPPGWRDLGRWLVTTNEGAVFFATESGWERLPLPPVSLVAGGSVSGCAMLTDGETRCWDTERFLYREGQRVMDELLGLSDITAGSGGCGIDAWGRVVCWSQSVLESEPRAVAGVSDAIALTAWSGGTCALTETGEVLCWGRSPQGGREDDSSPTRIARVEGANQLSSGGEPPIVCATTGDGVTRCFGPGGEPPGASGFTFDGDSGGACGRAGDGGIVCGSEEGWTAQADAHEVVELAGNEFDLCWRDRSGSVQCRASRPPSLAPVDELVAGETHFCARLADATVRCWGECVHGPDALARDDEESPCDPYGASRVPLGLANVRQIGAGTAFSCALVEGAVRCWGDTPWRGELGLDAVTHIAVGPEHLCAISGGEVFCVGSSGFGQLGNGIGGAAPVVMIR
ncbi:MAG: RCC1 domain-containing protein [Sandaracinaceae bacterium]